MGQVFTPPHYRAVMASEEWWAHAALIVVYGATRAIMGEPMLRSTDSFVEGKVPEPYDLQGRNITFTVEQPGVRFSKQTFYTTFPLPTVTAAQVAAEIVGQNPSLTSAVYATADGKIRIGVGPEAGKVFRITIVAGTALEQLGLKPGQSVDVSPDQLNNPWLTTPVVITDGVTTGSTASTSSPCQRPARSSGRPRPSPSPTSRPPGLPCRASYSYQMRREVLDLVGKIKEVNDVLQFEWS